MEQELQSLETEARQGLQNLDDKILLEDFRIRFLEGPACEQLRRLGFCETLQIRKLANGRNLICSVCGTRMALSRDLADQVLVSPEPA